MKDWEDKEDKRIWMCDRPLFSDVKYTSCEKDCDGGCQRVTVERKEDMRK